ncbi:hypothetical protein [Solibacillus isronensis]|uniref:hypothetical protein n=1 Tax=Solibacillus isronensis TaxID=412383 RepID=UPI0039A1FAE7
MENTAVDLDESLYGFPLTERYTRFEKKKDAFTNTRAIIGSGMNPGVVQWMAIKLLKDHTVLFIKTKTLSILKRYIRHGLLSVFSMKLF